MNRKCPNCSDESVSVSRLILSDVRCASCGQIVGVQTVFRVVFFVIILIATLFTVLVVLVDQGLYAALLMMTLPIGAIGIIKARYCPLAVRKSKTGAEGSSS